MLHEEMAGGVEEGMPEEGMSEEQSREQMLAMIDALGQSLAKTRSDAIAGRMNSGIEDDWTGDEEYYQGIDDANRGEFSSAWRTKPPGQEAPRPAETTRSTVFPNITAPYVDAAAARIADMLLPSDDRNFEFKRTPIPQLEEMAGLTNVEDGELPQGAPLPQPQSPEWAMAQQGMAPSNVMPQQAPQGMPQPSGAQMQPQGMPQGPQGAPMPQGGTPPLSPAAQASQEAMRILDEADAKAKKAQDRIDDWLVECQWHAQVRKVIEDAARIGVGVLKGPVPMKRVRTNFRDGQVVRSVEIVPGSKWIDPWNFYPDPACGENIHNGSYCWERDMLTRKQLQDLLEIPDYIQENILQCLKEGPFKAEAMFKPTPDEQFSNAAARDRFEIWYFHGMVEREHLEAMGCECPEDEVMSMPAVLEMVNNRVIKAALNPLDAGEYPYDAYPWRRRSGSWAGIGVARQGRPAQNIFKATVRNLMDNAGMAAGPMIVFRQGVVTPADSVAGIAPRKLWYIAPDAEEFVDANKAIGQVKIDMLVNELLAIANFALKMMEDVTGLPMLLQGQMGEQKIDRVQIATILNNNGSAVLRRLARLFDDNLTEPHVRRYYTWLMQYGEDDEKGDYVIDARGSSALVERDMQNQQIPEILQAAANPIFGLDPKKSAEEWLKSRHFDPKRFKYDDEKWQQIVENMAKGPQDPRLEVAKLQAEKDLQIAQLQKEGDDLDRKVKVAMFQIDKALEGEELTQDGQRALDELKAGLSETVMKLKTQIQLSREAAGHQARSDREDRAHSEMEGRKDRIHDREKNRENNRHKTLQTLKPPTEPAGRAKPGRAFQA